MMTRKDYNLLASAIREGILNTEAIYGENGYGPCLEIMTEVKVALRQDNPRFDDVRFDKACTNGTGLQYPK